jgi:hypothetical protein
MNDGIFGFGHVIFHLVLIIVLHGNRSPQVFETGRKQKPKASRDANEPKVVTKLQSRRKDALKQ